MWKRPLRYGRGSKRKGKSTVTVHKVKGEKEEDTGWWRKKTAK